MKKITAFLLLLMTFITTEGSAYSQNPQNPLFRKWIITFNGEEEKSLKHYNPIILEPEQHPPLTPLKVLKKTLLGYLSLGEVCTTRPYFEKAKEAGVLIGPNPHYPGSWFVDIRNPAWRTLLLQEIIPTILEQGFNGLALDTLDISLHLEQNNRAFLGMMPAAIELIYSIHETFPEISLLLQRAYPLLNQVGGYLDYALGESVLTTYNTATHSYAYIARAEYEWQVRQLHAAQSRHPNLTVLTLDYWNPEDAQTIAKIYGTQRQNGFRPYVATPNLMQVVAEP